MGSRSEAAQAALDQVREAAGVPAMPAPVTAPHPREWPEAVRFLIAKRMVKRALSVWGGDEQGRAIGWQRLLVATYAGQPRGGVRLRHHLTVDEAYALALEDLAKEGA